MVCDRKWQRDGISSEDASALLLILSNAVLRWSRGSCLGLAERGRGSISTVFPWHKRWGGPQWQVWPHICHLEGEETKGFHGCVLDRKEQNVIYLGKDLGLL